MIGWAVSVSGQERSLIACAHAYTPHHYYQTKIQENSVPQLRSMMSHDQSHESKQTFLNSFFPTYQLFSIVSYVIGSSYQYQNITVKQNIFLFIPAMATRDQQQGWAFAGTGHCQSIWTWGKKGNIKSFVSKSSILTGHHGWTVPCSHSLMKCFFFFWNHF